MYIENSNTYQDLKISSKINEDYTYLLKKIIHKKQTSIQKITIDQDEKHLQNAKLFHKKKYYSCKTF